jgi:hypothetical protein
MKFPRWSQWFLTTADPPMTITGHLPRPLGKSTPIKANWYDICNTDTPEFVKLHKQALATPFKERTVSMRVVVTSVFISVVLDQIQFKMNLDYHGSSVQTPIPVHHADSPAWTTRP